MWKDCLVLLNNAITKSSKEVSEHVHKLEQLSEHEKIFGIIYSKVVKCGSSCW